MNHDEGEARCACGASVKVTGGPHLIRHTLAAFAREHHPCEAAAAQRLSGRRAADAAALSGSDATTDNQAGGW